METPLIICYEKAGQYLLDPCKQGIVLLRELKNQRLRIVLNVIHEKPKLANKLPKTIQWCNNVFAKGKIEDDTIDIQKFNRVFVNSAIKKQQQMSEKRQERQYNKKQQQPIQQNFACFSMHNAKQIQYIKVNAQKELDLDCLNRKLKQISKGQNIKLCGLLTIHRQWVELSQQRAVIVMNAYEQSYILGQQHKHLDYSPKPLLSILGYLSASTFIYHKKGQITTQKQDKCQLTTFLGQFKKILSATDIDKLDQQTKYKSGFSKKPYFLCLLYQSQTQFIDEVTTNYLRQKYTYCESDTELNQAVDTFLNYFPERSALKIEQNQFQEIVESIANQFLMDVVGRQLLSFQFTGSTLQSLCFQFCEAMNRYVSPNVSVHNFIKKGQSINLLQIYCKIIANQRARVQNLSNQRYLRGLKIIKKQIPLSEHDLLLKHSIFSESVVRQSIEDSKNCMDFSEFIPIYNRLQSKIESTYQQILALNQQKMQQVNIANYEALQSLELQDGIVDSPSIIQQLFQLHKQKLNLFYDQSLGFEKASLLLRLSEKHGQQMLNAIMRFLQRVSQELRENKLKSDQLSYENQVLREQNKKLTTQYQLQGQVLNSYKLKVENLKISQKHEDSPKKIGEIGHLQKRIQQLNEQIDNKNIQIDELYAILQNFQGVLQKSKGKFKFAKEITEAVKEVNDCLVGFHKLIAQVNRTQQRQKQLKNSFRSQKDRFIADMQKQQRRMQELEAQTSRIARQKNSLEQLIQEARKAVRVMKSVEQQYKDTIHELEIRSTRMNCLLAETEESLEIHIKAVRLLVDHVQKGKSENLMKFIKVLKNEELKDILKVIKK